MDGLLIWKACRTSQELQVRNLGKRYRMLINSAINEEVDYKIKRLALIRDQARFEEFKHMVAVKILREGLLIHGSEDIFYSAEEFEEFE